MNLALAEALDLAELAWAPVALIFFRISAAMAILPVVGERSLPQRVRLVLAIAFTVVVAPAVVGAFPAPPDGFVPLLGWAAIEIVAGLAIGISLRLFVITLQVAGAMAAQSTSLSQIFGGAAADPQPAIGHLLVIAGLALAVTVGLHVRIAEHLILSYQLFPPGQPIPAADLAEWGTGRTARAFSLAFSIAAPFVIASMIYNITLGTINRAMPQLMVSFVGAPAITAGGLILLFLCAPLMLAVWLGAMQDFLVDPAGLAR